jgi:hypothetical protein
VKFVLSLKDLGEHGDWAREGYVCYLGALLHIATKNAHPLCKLSTQLQDDKGATAEWHVDVPSPAELTDIMLAEQMKRLPTSGKYSVVSNAESWKGGQLVKLHRESEIGVKKTGVKIRRIFAMADRHVHRLGVKRDEVKRMFKQHLAASQAWKSKALDPPTEGGCAGAPRKASACFSGRANATVYALGFLLPTLQTSGSADWLPIRTSSRTSTMYGKLFQS